MGTKYDDMLTKGFDEAIKAGASYAVVKAMRKQEIKGMDLTKFAVLDYIYSTYIEPSGSTAFGVKFPKLDALLGETASTARETKQLTYGVNKWAYVSALAWVFGKAGFANQYTRAQAYNYALAYALRAGVGIAMENTSPAV